MRQLDILAFEERVDEWRQNEEGCIELCFEKQSTQPSEALDYGHLGDFDARDCGRHVHVAYDQRELPRNIHKKVSSLCLRTVSLLDPESHLDLSSTTHSTVSLHRVVIHRL